MGCCLSSPIPPSSGTASDVKSPDPVKPDVNKPTKPAIELPVKPVTELGENRAAEEAKQTISEKLEKEEEENVLRKKTESEEASKPVVRTSSCTEEEVDAILIQCGKLSRSNSAAKTRRYSGSKRSFDFDQNERIRGGDVEEEGRKTPQRNRGVERVNNGSPRERRRRTPSREREDCKSYRSGSRERERGGSRRVSRSPAKRNPRGSLVISSDTKFVTVPATDQSSKRVTKRSIGEACRTASAAMTNAQPPPREQSQSPYRRRKPLGDIDQNATKGGDKKKKKMMIKRENESVMSRSRSLRKSRDFDFSPETLLLQASEQEDKSSSYTALLLKDIKDFHGGKSSNDDNEEVEEDSFSRLPSCVTKACSIVEAVADLNSTTSDSNQFRFTSTVKKADLMEPSFEKYVTVKRGGCCSLEEQESSCASNSLT